MRINTITRIIPGLAMLVAPCTKAASNYNVLCKTPTCDVFQHQLARAQAPSTTKTVPFRTLANATSRPIIHQSATNIGSKCSLSAEQLNAAIESLLPQRNLDRNRLRDKGDVFIAMGEKYGVNPITMVAIAMCESSRGISNAALSKNNIGGLTGNRGLLRFNSVDDCIEKMAQILQRHVQNNRETVEKLGRSGRYCARSSASHWIQQVNFYIRKIENHQ